MDAMDAVGAFHIFDAGLHVVVAAVAEAKAGVLVVELAALGVLAAAGAGQGTNRLGQVGVGFGGGLCHGILRKEARHTPMREVCSRRG
ncbi:hypothetical protein C6571_18125 (plasmid) [Simplicispira suum]|uniref:Uncharacterized protein n=1 Tax=Simplicispira suum TaxID=2109915 RepID=A0A2S0N5X3_9BURK|nr:hypothetical protein C6571_18125 [Simplicispira suum]